MKPPISDIAFTPSVKSVQERLGSRRQYARMEERGGWIDTVTPELKDFLSQRDSCYFGTASADGRPYIQHRGGPKGFVKVLDDHTLAFADFIGNRQYISVGNLAKNDQAFLFFMDYEQQTRIKVWGRAAVIDDDPQLSTQLTDSQYKGKSERVIRFHIDAWDANCPQHIQPRFTLEAMSHSLQDLKDRISELERENSLLRAGQPT